LKVESSPRSLSLHIYIAEEIELVVCNGQNVTPRQVSPHHYTAEVKNKEQ